MDPLLESFYQFLKEKYGIAATEHLDTTAKIKCVVEVKIPGLAKETKKQCWTIHLETVDGNHSFILGTYHSKDSLWSRYVQIEKYPNSSKYFFKLIASHTFFEKEHNLESFIAFVKVCDEFFVDMEVEA